MKLAFVIALFLFKSTVLAAAVHLRCFSLSIAAFRFQIFVKVPFPSLGDKFVKAKLDYNPAWYDWQTCTSILQGVGRSVRSEDDWAITYFLDGCLKDLFKRSRRNFPIEFQMTANNIYIKF